MNRLTALAVSSMVAIALVGCGSGKAKDAKSEDYAIPVATDKVQTGKVRDVISATANIAPRALVTLFSNVSGAVTNLNLKEGDRVKKGQLIAMIDKEKAGFQAQQAQGGLEMAKANLTNMESNYKRLEKLRNDKAIPEKMWDDIQAGVSAAKGQLEQVQGLVNLANSQVSDARIVATIDGIIAKKHIDQGEVVVSAQMMKQAPIVTIVDMDVVKVLIGITEKDIEKIKKGMDAEVTVDAWPGKVFHGKVTNIAPIVNPMNRTIEVELQIENRSGALKPGMFARVQIITDVHENSVLIPLDAVIDSESGKNVFVVEGQKAVRRDIKTGFLESTRLEVTNGLKGGEELVVLGQQRLKDGVKVKSQPIQSLGGIK